ncbi:MAG: O-antigen ligase family protein [Syntrophaceae bacterium]|nr:O-antigen ligase family protein [Syntrophaceae bacterium]
MTWQSVKFIIIMLIVFWFVLYGINTGRQIRLITEGLLILGVIEAVYGMVQLLPGNHYSLFWMKTVNQNVATGTFIDSNHLAGFLSMIICVGIGYMWSLVQKPKREISGSTYLPSSRIPEVLGLRGLLCLLSVAVMMAGLLSTASRGGTVSVIIGILLMAGLLASRMVRRQAVFYPVVLILIVSLYLGYVASDRVIQRFAKFDSGFEGRVALTRSTLEMAKDFPLTGIGLGVFQFVFPRYQDTQLTALIDYAHNDWAQMFAETGAIGLGLVFIGFIWFIGLVIVRWRKRRNPLSLGIGLGGMGALFAISVHSFSEFNLHMPANVLVLAVILAVAYKVLYLHGKEGEVYFTYPAAKISMPRVASVALVIIVVAGAFLLGRGTVALWRADSMARTFWNSTVSFVEPTNHQLRKAWFLVPGNAAYWEWVARRVYEGRDGYGELINGTPYEQEDDPEFDLWKEALMRNPGYWRTWQNMGWAAYQKHSQNPKKYYPIALAALNRSVDLHPYDAQGHFVKGIVGIAAMHDGHMMDDSDWQNAFRQALELDPSYAKGVTGQILFYLKNDVSKVLRVVIPARAALYRDVAQSCFKKGAVDEGLEFLKEGERMKEVEIGLLWKDYARSRAIHAEEGEGILKKILDLDSSYSKALLEKGRVLEALKMQVRRNGHLAGLGDLNSIQSLLKKVKRGKESRELPYYKGLVEEELANKAGAIQMYKRMFEINPQHFPTWIRLRHLLKARVRNAGDEMILKSLERKINLFAMDSIPASSWRLRSRGEEMTNWIAPFRCRNPLVEIEIRFATDKSGAWKLMVDGRFVTAWKGSKKGKVSINIPAGEHDMELVYFGQITELEKRQAPFSFVCGL